MRSVLGRHEELASAIEEDPDAAASSDDAPFFRGRDPTTGSWLEGAVLPLAMRQRSTGSQDSIPRREEMRAAPVFLQKRGIPPDFARPSRGFAASRVAPSGLAIRGTEVVGTRIFEQQNPACDWGSVAVSRKEDLSLDALSLAGQRVERVAIVGDGPARHCGGGRRVVGKLWDCPDTVPLASLRDGITCLFEAGWPWPPPAAVLWLSTKRRTEFAIPSSRNSGGRSCAAARGAGLGDCAKQ